MRSLIGRSGILRVTQTSTYQPQGDDAHDVHHDMTALAEHHGIQGHEWLRRTEIHQSVWVRLQWASATAGSILGREKETNRAEQEQNDRSGSANAADKGTPEDASGGSHGSVLRLLCDVARGVEADQNSGGGEIRETPVPALLEAGSVVGQHEGVVGRPKPPGVVGADGEPDKIHEEVQQDDERREVEDPSEIFRYVSQSRGLRSNETVFLQHTYGA